MDGKRPLTSRGVLKRSERERSVGLDADDEAARWLDENTPKDEAVVPKSLRKSRELHRWRNRHARDELSWVRGMTRHRDRDRDADDRPPICPACGVTQGLVVSGEETAFACLECGFADAGGDDRG